MTEGLARHLVGQEDVDSSDTFNSGVSSLDLTDDDFADFEDVLDDLGEDFDPSHVLTFSVPAGETICVYQDILEEELADPEKVRPGEKETTLVVALFVSGGQTRDINVEVGAAV